MSEENDYQEELTEDTAEETTEKVVEKPEEQPPVKPEAPQVNIQTLYQQKMAELRVNDPDKYRQVASRQTLKKQETQKQEEDFGLDTDDYITGKALNDFGKKLLDQVQGVVSGSVQKIQNSTIQEKLLNENAYVVDRLNGFIMETQAAQEDINEAVAWASRYVPIDNDPLNRRPGDTTRHGELLLEALQRNAMRKRMMGEINKEKANLNKRNVDMNNISLPTTQPGDTTKNPEKSDKMQLLDKIKNAGADRKAYDTFYGRK